jgi:hypothetical protein
VGDRLKLLARLEHERVAEARHGRAEALALEPLHDAHDDHVEPIDGAREILGKASWTVCERDRHVGTRLAHRRDLLAQGGRGIGQLALGNQRLGAGRVLQGRIEDARDPQRQPETIAFELHELVRGDAREHRLALRRRLQVGEHARQRVLREGIEPER